MDTIEGPRAPAVKLTARHSSEGCSPVSVVGTLKALAHPPKTKEEEEEEEFIGELVFSGYYRGTQGARC